jgi:hypothetical protein
MQKWRTPLPKMFNFTFFMAQALLYKSKIYSAKKMEGDAPQSWCRMRDCADHNKKDKNVGS